MQLQSINNTTNMCIDLKFNNMENNAQYMMLFNKLKDSKKSLKKTNKDKTKKMHEAKGRGQKRTK